MKTNSLRCLACLSLVAWLALPPRLAAADKPPAAKPAAEPKSHVLFMGADLQVQREQNFYRVRDVVGSEFKIRIGQKEFFVPTRQRQTKLKVDYGLKLSDAAVRLDGLESGPGYTPGNDPRLEFDRASGAAGGAAAVQDLAYGRMVDAQLTSGFASAAALNAPRAETQAAADAAQARLDDSMRQLDASSQMRWQDQYNTGNLANKMERDLAEGNYDAMEVSFKVSSPVELDDPYMVVLFRFLEREAKPGQEGMLIHAKSLEPIGPKPRYVRVREGGMPVGFKYVDCQVHIYNHGVEVATNVSPQRVELSRDEARLYLLMEHLGAHKGATLPASAVAGTLPLARRSELSVDQLRRTAYAKVDKDGVLRGVYEDEGCGQPVEDARYVAALGEMFFQPALAQGKAVDGVARLRLGDL